MEINTPKIKNIPIPLAFFLAILGLAGGIILINKKQSLSSSAYEESSPHNIKITNINSSSFTVSWTTNSPNSGQIAYKESSGQTEKIAKDKRDENQAIPKKYLVHFVQVKNLFSNTNYSFKIISGDKSYGEEGNPFRVKTPSAQNPLDSDIAQGRIVTSEGQPAAGVIVYLSLPNTVVQSALTDNDGNWMIPLSNAFSTDLQNLSNYDRNAQIEEIMVQGEKETSLVTLTTGNDNPAPEIILGQNQNFLNQGPLPTATPAGQNQSSGDGFQGSSIDQNLSVSFPTENENVNSLKPEFFGNGPKDKVLEITIESGKIISGKTTVDANGKWRYSPESNLTPGEHKLTVSYIDDDGFVKKIQRNFTVLATSDSSLPSFTATPSGEIGTPTPSIKPQPTAKTQPTVTIPPTAAPTAAPQLLSPTLSQQATVPPAEKTPTSGARLPTFLLFIFGSVSILFGIALLL